MKTNSATYQRIRKWLLGCLTPAFAVCLAVGLIMYFPISSGVRTYAATVTANPLINSNIGKHSEWYYGFGSTEPTLDPVSQGYARWYAQLGVDVGMVKAQGKSIEQSAREHKLVQASSYKEGATDKVFIIDSPEEAAKVWTEAVEFALGQSEDSPFKDDVDQSLDPITGMVQQIPGGGVARGNYFADPYEVDEVNGQSGQKSYRGKYITVKLNCDWYAKDIETNIAFALGNSSSTPSGQVTSGAVTHDKRWITTFNWAKDQETFEGYWLDETNNWNDKDITRKEIRGGYSQSDKVTFVPGEGGTATNRQLTSFTTDGHGYDNSEGYYASYDLSTMADQVANAQGQEGFNISSPFSYGRINVPTGAYIVLDLNGHTISRGLTEENNEEIAAHGSILKSKYEYDLGEMDALNRLVQIYDGKTLGEVDGGHLYGNELCYYGSVMTVQPKARLEIVDSTAFERASDGRITASGNTYTTNHKGTVTGGCTDEKYYVNMDNDLGVENGAYFGYNSNEGKGGAVHVNASGELVVHSGTFKDNQAQFGGAFYALSRAAVLVYNGYFINNYATLRGGATYVASLSRSVFTFYDGVISYNRSADGGGGVYLCDNAYVNLHGGYITHNQAGRWGGGIYIGDKGEGLLENVKVTQNVSGLQGGGIYVYQNSKFKFAGSLIVTQNKGNCGEFYTRDTVSNTTYKTPYVLRLIVDGVPVTACGWDGDNGAQSRYNWTGFATSLTTGYTRTTTSPALSCKHDGTGEETREAGKGVHNYSIDPNNENNPDHVKTYHPYAMWSLGDAFNKEYNCIGGVIWTNPGDTETIGTGGEDNNVYLADGAKIIIDGPLFANGIGAQIGVTMAGAGDFTTNYNKNESSVEPHLYFTSDDSTKSVVWNVGNTEATFGSKTEETDLIWEITGYLYGQPDKPVTITASGDSETSFVWNINSPAYHPANSNPGMGIDSFKWTGKTMLFDHKMFEVTKVVAKQGMIPLRTWEINALEGEEHQAGIDYTFHYLLAEQGAENEPTNDRLIYAGDYSFRMPSGHYSNATFTIHINQLGVGVSAYEVKDGKETWRAKGDIFKDGKIPTESEIKTYLEGALYYRGTAYDFVLDSKYDPAKGTVTGKEDEGKFTGAVMKFIYANTDFFGTDVEIDFGAVDFELEYYWRELTDNSQQDLEKTNYFLHAGYYEVRGAHEVVTEDGAAPAVDYMKNNIAFQSAMHLPIQRVSVSVWLEDNACVKEDVAGYYGYPFKDAVYTTKQILYFNNNDEAGNDPELDPNVTVKYYLFDDYIKHGPKAREVGIQDNSDGSERWGVRDAGKYVVHVSLNTQMWIESDTGKGDFTERGKPYNDYIFTSKETQRLAEVTQKDEQGRDVVYEFAYYFFIQPAEIKSWTTEPMPNQGEGSITLADRVYDATDNEPSISGRYSSDGADRGLYNYPDMPDETVVAVRYLSKKDYPNEDDIKVTADEIQANDPKWKNIWDAKTVYDGMDDNGNPILKSKFQPVDAGDYWILVYFRGVMPVNENNGATGDAEKYTPVTNFKGVFIGTYRIIPVEVTVSGSLSFTYDGRSYERARYLPPADISGKHHDEWYESIFFLVQDNITTPGELIDHQHEDNFTTSSSYYAYEGDTATTRDLADLWGRDSAQYDDATYHKNRFTLTAPTVAYSNDEFKQHDISLGIGLYAFKTKSADKGNYRLTNAEFDGETIAQANMTGPRVTTEPTNEGVTWIITYQPKDGKQVQAFNTSQNFVIKSDSTLEVTINSKDIGELAGDITKVGSNDFTHWKDGTDKDNPGDGTLKAEGGNVATGISYPFAGDNWAYRPDVTIGYQPFYYATSVESAKGKTEYGGELTLQAGQDKDYTISYMSNTSATGSNSARIVLAGFGNYSGFLTLTFTITPAKIAVQYAGVGAVPQYDKTAHGVNVTYANVEDDAIYQQLKEANILVSTGGGGDFKKPQPDASVYTITYKARTRTSDGFGAAAKPDEITDSDAPINAGVYDVKILLGSSNYQFVNGTGGGSYFTPVTADGYSNTATGSHTILPAVVSYAYANSGEIYNRQAHTPRITFTNITYEQNPTLAVFQNVVPQSDEYTVTIDGKESATDAGSYTITVQLLSHNYCFELELSTREEFIHGYKDGSKGEEDYPSSTNRNTFNYNYTIREGNIVDPTYHVEGSWTAPEDYVIKKATIQLGQFTDSTYNRAAQPQTPVFSNTQSNNEAVPTNEGQNAGQTISSPEYEITYIDNNVITSGEKNSCNEEGLPFYAELYSVQISLTDAGAKNFEFQTKTIPAPHFTHSETAGDELLKQNVTTGEATNSIITAPFLINRVDINVTQLYASDVYNAQDHFVDPETLGFALDAMDSVTNWVSAMFRYSSSAAIEADDLTVDVIFTKTTGDLASATVHYTPTTSDDTVEYGSRKDYSFKEFAEVGFFTHVANYTVTVKFSEESFYISNSGATDNNLQLGFTYTITPAQIAFSLSQSSISYDTEEHKPTQDNDGIVLTNSANADVLPKLVEGTETGIDQGAVAYDYTGWAGSGIEASDGYKNVGNYTVTVTLQEGGDFQFADGSSSLSREFTIVAMDISLPENFGAAVFTPDETAGHDGYTIPAYHYTGAEIKPEITLTDEKGYHVTLKTTDTEVVGLTVAYTENINAGPATAMLTGINNFTGTRKETFYVLPAVVSITASDSNSHTETFNPNTEPKTVDRGSLTFSYNKTLQFLTYAFENLCGMEGTLPNNADYTVEYYTAANWDTENNKPKDTATALEGEGVTDSGDYYVWFQFTKGTKDYSNFVFYKEKSGSSLGDMFDTTDPHLFAYGFKLTVNPADIQIHLPEQFRNGSEFVNKFPYTATDYATVLNSVTLSGENGVVPETKDYTVAFYTVAGEVGSAVPQARNADDYYLAFILTDALGNYRVTAVYAGSDDNQITVKKADSYDEDGYYASDETLKNISVHFVVETAKIEVYLSNQFLKTADKSFISSFGYDRSDWRTRLNPVRFKNELRNSVIPINTDYQVTFMKGADPTTQVINAGSYTLKFELIGDNAQNFIITYVRAGTAPDTTHGEGNYVELKKPDNYTTMEEVDMRSFEVGFEIIPADIEIHLAKEFVGSGEFINSFVYTRANRYTALSVISITNADNVLPTGSDYTVSFKTVLADDATTVTLTDVGKYYLIFKFNSEEVANDYNVTAIYAGDGTVSVPKAGTAEDKGYYGSSMKDFSVKFEITPAQIEVYLSETFRNEEDFVNSFGFNKSDWTNTLNSVQFKNVLRNGIFPQNGEYTVALKSVDERGAESDAATVRNVGTYKLVITLVKDGAKNYEIVDVYAGTPSATAGSGDAVKLEENADKGYVKTESDPFTAFSVQFKITPAEIQVHVPEQFKQLREGVYEFVNQFTYNKSSRKTELGAVTLSGVGDIVPASGEYTISFVYDDNEDDTITNVGKYQLVFELSDDAGNYVITAIYVGSDSSFDLRENAGDAYHPLEGTIGDKTLKKFGLDFEITPAEIDLYLNGFIKDGAFTNEFVYDGTNQSSKLGSVDFFNEGYIIPANQGYSVTFYYDNIDGHVGTDAKNDVFDAGKYFLYFALTEGAGGNYVLRNVFAGPTSGGVELTDGQYRNKTETGVYVDFTITPSEINVFFSSSDLVKGGEYVSSFHYDRSDWTNRFNAVVFDTVKDGVGTTPTTAQYTIEFYGGTYKDGKEDWGDRATTLDSIINVGRYSVTFRLSNDYTTHYPDAKFYNNYKIVNVYAGGSAVEDGKSVQLRQVTAPETNGYRISERVADDVYVTLVFDLTPAPIEIHLAEGFKGTDALNNSFVYNKSNRALTLGNSNITGTTIPLTQEYSFVFKTDLAGDATETVIDVGKYYLVFKLDDEWGNYTVTGIYAGNDTSVKLESVDIDGDGYHGDVKDFSVKFEITPAPITVHIAGDFNGSGSLKAHFPYNKTDYATALKSVSFAGDTTPSSGEYIVKFTADGTDAERIINAGDYILVFELTGTAATNYYITAIDTGTDGYKLQGDDYTNTSEDPFTAFTVAFTIDKATVNVYLSEEFVKDGKFNSSFNYDRSNWVSKLNTVTFTNIGEDDTVPTVGTDYTLLFGNPTDNVTNVTDAGDYTLFFELINTNFKISAIYAGTESVTATTKDKSDKKFSVEFVINKAQLLVYLADGFNGGDKLTNTFGYNKTNQSLVLGTVQFANAIEGGVIPAGRGYVTFKQTNDVTDVTNVGNYTLNFALKGDEVKNFVIKSILAGDPTGSPYTLQESDYTKEGDPFTAFSVAFEIIPAEIQIHLSEQFRSGSEFVGSFTYNKSSWATALGSVTLTGEGGIVPTNGEYTVTFMLKDAETVSDATNVGNYRLVFELTDDAGNYVITAIYAGKGEDFNLREKAKDAYQALEGTIEGKNLKKFQLAFAVTPAELDLYLNAFLKGEAFTNQFVYDGTDQSVRLGIVEFKQDQSIVPIPEAYSVTFFYNLDGHRNEKDDVDVYDVGKYTLFFQFTEAAGGNYVLRDIYAGPTSSVVKLTEENWSEMSDTLVKVNFELTPSVINVFFSAGALKNGSEYVNEFYYNRNDWTNSFGSIYLDAVAGGAVPQGSQYSVEYYSGKLEGGEEKWGDTPVTEIYNVGRYSVTFRLSNMLTGHYPDVKHYNNFTINNVYAGGTKTTDSVLLESVKAPDTKGYRINEELKVYITLVFDIKPNVVRLSDVRDVIFNDDAQDAGFSFEIVDGQGAVLPELDRGDFSLEYSFNDAEKTGNEKMKGDKPYFAGAYTVALTLSDNFVFDKPDGTREATRNFRVTPVVLSAYLGYEEDGEIKRGSSLTYDGLPHEYKIYTSTTAAAIPLREGENVYQVQTAVYNGWAGENIDDSDSYKNAGTYTITLSFYILGEGGSSTGSLGGNFSFGDTYTMSLTYTIQQRTITDADVHGIENGERKVYNGKPQTNGIVVRMALVEGAEETVLKVYDTETKKGDYSISNTSDINVGYVTNIVTGMQNFQGAVNLSYYIDPAVVTAEIDETSLPYNAQEQSRAFTFFNKSGTEVLPAYNTNEGVSDYTIAYTYQVGDGISVTAPRNAGVYTVTVTLKNSAGFGDSSNFTFDESLAGRVDGNTATFTFTITKAEIYLDVIPDASYTGEPLPAKIGFVNAVHSSVVPSAYDIIYDEGSEEPTHVKTNGDRTPIAYSVKVTLKNIGENATDADRDLDNFIFIAHEGSGTYTYDEESGAWGREAYKITPAVITGSLSVMIDGVAKDTTSNVYDAKQHVLDVVFRNISAGFESVIPVGTKGEASIDNLVATYDFAVGETVLYTLTITFAPNYNGFTTFDGIPVNAGSYLVAVALKSADFSFVGDSASFDWTYVISNAKIGARETVGTHEDTATFRREYTYAPDNPHDITLTAKDFIFVEDADGYNVENATFTFTSCTGATYEPITNEEGLPIGYKLKGAGEYTITVSVDAPNHDRWDITLKITVDAQAIKLVVTAEAHFEATYGDADAYTSENVLEQVLQFIRDEKILVENIAGSPAEKAETLVSYGFAIRILTHDDSYSNAHYLKAGNYGLAIGSMEVGGFSGNFVVFAETDSTLYTGNVFTVNPLAIQVATDDGINDLRYNGTSLVAAAANHVVISNLFEGDDVFFASARYGFSEGGNFNNGTVFDLADAIHVGNYCVHVFGRDTDTENGLSGADSANYMIEVKDADSTTIRYSGTNGVYVAFEIKRREVELAIANSTSTYGEAEAVYGTDGAKKFNFSFTDSVLTKDFSEGDKAAQLNQFVLDLLALFDSTGAEKLDRTATPYPGAGNYMVKLDPDAGKTAEGTAAWVLGGGRFNFDKDYILRIDDTQGGTHVIGKRAMRVSVNDYSSYYGEELKENGFEGSEGNWGFNALDQFVEGDSEKDLAITITRDGAQFTAQGTQTEFNHWSAMTYKNGLKPDSMSANYDVTFTEDSGNYIIKPRPVIVLIHKQSSVYGEPRVDDLTGSSAWDIYGTLSEDNMGCAIRESRVELHVTLSIESVVNETASAGVYENVIKGTSANPNYHVTFRNWVTDGGKNEPGDHEGGDYEITRRSVAIRIGSAEGVYGTEGLHAGAQISLVAPVYTQLGSDYDLQNAGDAQWRYNFDEARYTILPQHLGYLTFYLGKADPANTDELYATVGAHAIVGVWGFGYDAAMTFMKSYDVKFYGAWEGSGEEDPNYKVAGIFTVTPADILQRHDSDWVASDLFRMYEDGAKTPATGWNAMKIAADYLIYAGDYTDASNGTLVFVPELSDDAKLVYHVMVDGVVRATITYSKPINTTEIEQEVEAVDNLWNVHSVGIWTMQVMIEADNHKTATFTYTFEIEAVVAKVMLNTSAPAMEAVYGEYAYILPDTADYATQLQDLPLTSVLHEYLENSIMYVDGLADAYPGTDIIDWINMVLDHCRVEVANAKISTSGMLQAGRYHLRIVAESGCGFTVAFVDGVPDDDKVDFSGYDRLIIDRKELGIDWIGTNAPELNETKPELRGGAVIYTYSSYNYHFDPLFTQVVESGLGKDIVNDPEPIFYDAENVLCTPRDVGTYRIAINDALFAGKDAANYKLPEQLEIELHIIPMEVTVTLFDREITYGDDLPDIVSPTAKGDGTVIPSPTWTCDKLGVKDDIRRLGVTVSYLNAEGGAVEYNSNAGVYRIVGSAPDSNYRVTFVNAAGEGDEAVLTIRRAQLTVTIKSITSGVVYGDDVQTREFAVTPQEGDDDIALWDRDQNTEELLRITLTVGDGTAKNVGSYYIRGDWTNKNYNIVFAGDWEGELPADYVRQDRLGVPTSELQGAGTYVIASRTVTVTIHTQHGTYGDPLNVRSGNDPTLWTAENLAEWHKADPYGALGIELEPTGAILADQVNAGTYKGTIKATQTKNLDNYTLVFRNEEGEKGFGTYIVDRRTVIITVHTQHSAYSEKLVDLVDSDLTFWTAKGLAPWHEADPYAALGIELTYESDFLADHVNAGTYKKAIHATQTENLNNYTLVFHNDEGEVAFGTYIVEKATNEWLKHFSLESMNEGETPDEELLSAAAKFGEVTVKYYYDELCTSEVTEELNALPKSTYYAKITVDGTSNYTELKEIKEFVVIDSFLVVNGGLDVTLYVCIFASQFIILTFALIFIRRKKTKKNEPKEMK